MLPLSSVNMVLKVAKFQPVLAKTVNLKIFTLGRKISTIFSALKCKMAVFLFTQISCAFIKTNIGKTHRKCNLNLFVF